MIKVLPQGAREQTAGDDEVLVVRLSQVSTVFLRGGKRRRRRAAVGPKSIEIFEKRGRRHGCSAIRFNRMPL